MGFSRWHIYPVNQTYYRCNGTKYQKLKKSSFPSLECRISELIASSVSVLVA